MILALKTDSPTAEIYLLDASGNIKKQKIWEAGRDLYKNLLTELEKITADFQNLTGLVVFRGPGSFTGLRIGITVMNTIAYAKKVPIAGTMTNNWLKNGINRLAKNENDQIVLPEYDRPANIVAPKK